MDYFRVDPAHTDEVFKTEVTASERPILVTIQENGVIITLEQAGRQIKIDFKDLDQLIKVLEVAQHTSCTIMKDLLNTPFMSEELKKIRDENFGGARPHFNLDKEV